jgi:hypothetical protein
MSNPLCDDRAHGNKKTTLSGLPRPMSHVQRTPCHRPSERGRPGRSKPGIFRCRVDYPATLLPAGVLLPGRQRSLAACRHPPAPRSVAVPATAMDKHSGAQRTTLPSTLPIFAPGRKIFLGKRRSGSTHGLVGPYRPRTIFVQPSYSLHTGGIQVKTGLIQVNTGKYR